MTRPSQPNLDPEGGLGGGGTPIFSAGKDASAPARPAREEQDTSKITTFKQKLNDGHHEGKWIRPTNKTNTGATHLRSFHCKLTQESLAYLDDQINEWLDTHPDYEVKFVTTSVGEWTGKQKEPHMIVQLWV